MKVSIVIEMKKYSDKYKDYRSEDFVTEIQSLQSQLKERDDLIHGKTFHDNPETLKQLTEAKQEIEKGNFAIKENCKLRQEIELYKLAEKRFSKTEKELQQLKDYTEHKKDCDLVDGDYWRGTSSINPKCTCGLNKLLNQ